MNMTEFEQAMEEWKGKNDVWRHARNNVKALEQQVRDFNATLAKLKSKEESARKVRDEAGEKVRRLAKREGKDPGAGEEVMP